MQPLLLDTCAVIWLSEGEKLADPAIDLLKAADDAGQFTYISPISAWELGLLASRGRIQLLITPQRSPASAASASALS